MIRLILLFMCLILYTQTITQVVLRYIGNDYTACLCICDNYADCGLLWCRLHDDVIRPDFTFALISEHIHVLNFWVNTQFVFCGNFILIRNKMKSFKAKFTKTASIKSSASTRSFVHDRSAPAPKEAAASG